MSDEKDLAQRQRDERQSAPLTDEMLAQMRWDMRWYGTAFIVLDGEKSAVIRPWDVWRERDDTR